MRHELAPSHPARAPRGLGRAMTLGRAGIPVVATATRERAEIGPIATEAGKNMALPVLADVTREVDAEYVVKAALV